MSEINTTPDLYNCRINTTESVTEQGASPVIFGKIFRFLFLSFFLLRTLAKFPKGVQFNGRTTVFKTVCVGSIPATLDIYIARRNVYRHLISVSTVSNKFHKPLNNPFGNFHIYSRVKRTRRTFFSYKSFLRSRTNGYNLNVRN